MRNLFAQMFACRLFVETELGDGADLCTARNRTHRCEVPALASHRLYDKSAFEGRGGIADIVYGTPDDIERGIDSETVLGAENIVVDGTGNAYKVDGKVTVECFKSVVGAVSSEDDDTGDRVFFEIFPCLFAIFFS